MTQNATFPSQSLAGPAGLGDSDPVEIEFPTGLPGFPAATRFAVEAMGPTLDPFCRMRCVDLPDVCFTVVPPGVLFDDYTVTIDEEYAERLGLRSADDAVILTIVTLSVAPEPPKVNLLGPLVINRATRAAAQVVQHGSSYGVAVPLSVAGNRSACRASGT